MLLLLLFSSDVYLHQLPSLDNFQLCIIHSKTSTVLINSYYMSLQITFDSQVCTDMV